MASDKTSAALAVDPKTIKAINKTQTAMVATFGKFRLDPSAENFAAVIQGMRDYGAIYGRTYEGAKPAK